MTPFGGVRSLGFFLCRLLVWVQPSGVPGVSRQGVMVTAEVWISGVVIWPAMLPLSLARSVAPWPALAAGNEQMVMIEYGDDMENDMENV